MRRILREEIIVRPVEIYGKKIYGIKSILLTVSLRLHQKHFFGQPVGRVGLFRVAVPQVFFPKGDRREFWVGTDGADGYEFLQIDLACPLNELHPHHQVVVKKRTGVFTIGADPTHHRGQICMLARQLGHKISREDVMRLWGWKKLS